MYCNKRFFNAETWISCGTLVDVVIWFSLLLNLFCNFHYWKKTSVLWQGLFSPPKISLSATMVFPERNHSSPTASTIHISFLVFSFSIHLHRRTNFFVWVKIRSMRMSSNHTTKIPRFFLVTPEDLILGICVIKNYFELLICECKTFCNSSKT